jgi:hypothetical protein
VVATSSAQKIVSGDDKRRQRPVNRRRSSPSKSGTAGREALDDLHQPVLLAAIDLALQLKDPRPLPVAHVPNLDCFGEQVKLHPPLALSG